MKFSFLEGLGNEMRAVFRSGVAIWGAMCLHRLKRFEDFSPADIAFFARITPHLAAGLRAALFFDVAEAIPAANGPGMVLLAEDFSVVATTPGAELLLDEIGDWSQHSELPLSVYAVVGKLRALECNPGQSASVIPSVRLRTRSGRWLALHASRLSHPEPTQQIAIIIEQATPNAIAPLVLQAYALTSREQEVAGLVLKGHSTEDIAAHLCISMLTVQQRLKAVFGKVGVRSRRNLLVAQIFSQSYWPSLAESHGVSTDLWSPA